MNDDDSKDLKQAKRAEIQEQLLEKKLAYSQLLQGAEALHKDGTLFWTERWLLRLIATVAARRLAQLGSILPTKRPLANEARVKVALLEAAVEAVLGGHDLVPWVPTDDGWQAACKACGQTTWIGHNGLRYSLLAETCPSFQAPP